MQITPPQPAAGLHATTPRHIAASNEGPVVGRPVRKRSTSSYTGDEPSTSSLQCGSCGGSREVRATPPYPAAGIHATTPHSPSPTIDSPVLSTMRWMGPLDGMQRNSTARD